MTVNKYVLQDELKALINKHKETGKAEYLLTAIKISYNLGYSEGIDARNKQSKTEKDFYYYLVEFTRYNGDEFVVVEQEEFKVRDKALAKYNNLTPDPAKGEQVKLFRVDVMGRDSQHRTIRKKGATITTIRNML